MYKHSVHHTDDVSGECVSYKVFRSAHYLASSTHFVYVSTPFCCCSTKRCFTSKENRLAEGSTLIRVWFVAYEGDKMLRGVMISQKPDSSNHRLRVSRGQYVLILS